MDLALDLYDISYMVMGAENGTAKINTRLFDINILAYVYILPIIAGLGIIGNVANIITLLSKRLKAISYVYLLALAIADLLCMAFVLLFTLDWGLSNFARYEYMHSKYMIVWYRAHIMMQLINWAISSGILVVVALTVERYVSICWPLIFRQFNNKWRAYLIVSIAYTIPLILYIPMCWQWSVREQRFHDLGFDNDTVLYVKADHVQGFFGSKENDAVYKWVREILLKFIPIIIIGLLNLQIIFAFQKQKKNRNRMKNRTNSDVINRERDDRSLLYLLMAIVVLFFVCNVPASVNLVFITEKLKKQKAFKLFRAIANILEITNHAVNFYAFCLCSSDYRIAFLDKFPCFKRIYFRGRRMTNRLLVNGDASDRRRTAYSTIGDDGNNRRHGNEVETRLTMIESRRSTSPMLNAIDTSTIIANKNLILHGGQMSDEEMIPLDTVIRKCSLISRQSNEAPIMRRLTPKTRSKSELLDLHLSFPQYVHNNMSLDNIRDINNGFGVTARSTSMDRRSIDRISVDDRSTIDPRFFDDRSTFQSPVNEANERLCQLELIHDGQACFSVDKEEFL